jgi:hypothetical protein
MAAGTGPGSVTPRSTSLRTQSAPAAVMRVATLASASGVTVTVM